MDISLNSPITDIDLRYAKSVARETLGLDAECFECIPKYIHQTVRRSNPRILKSLAEGDIFSPKLIPQMVVCKPPSPQVIALSEFSYRCADLSYSAQTKGVFSQVKGKWRVTCPTVGSSLPLLSNQSLSFLQGSSVWQTLVSLITNRQLRSRVSWRQETSQGVEVCHNGGIAVVWDKRNNNSGNPVLCTWDMILMLKDLSYSRFLCSLAIDFLTRVDDNTVSHTDLSFIISWQEECLLQYDNNAHSIIKNIECLTKSAIIYGVDNQPFGVSVLRRMTQKCVDKERTIRNDHRSPQILKLVSYLLTQSRRTKALAEVFGLMKLSGHPVVDPVKGSISARKLATETLNTSHRDARAIRATVCHMFSRGFYGGNNRWPRLSFIRQDKKQGPSTLEALYMKSGRINLTADNYNIEDWDLCRFQQEYDFDYGEDFLDLISDKAISPKRSEVWSSWEGCVPFVIPKPTSYRRALLQVLDTENFHVRDITHMVSERLVPYDHLIVCVYPKEREMKNDARMFAMMTLEMRTFFVNTEHNIANGVFRHIPQQTMTMSRTSLVKRLLEMTGEAKQGYIRLNIESDFERWNLKWRERTVAPIARDFNDLYGVQGVFDYAHEFFSKCIVVLRHPSHPPEKAVWPQCPQLGPSRISWENHKGGFEGITQKMWTTPTLGIVYEPLSQMGLDFTMSGQADNQVISVIIPLSKIPDGMTRNEGAVFWSERITKAIEQAGLKVGQIVKPDECIESQNFISYGKELIANGVFLPSVVKQLSRVFPSCNTVQPSLMEYISSISSGCVSAAEKSDDPLCCFRVSQYVTSLTLIRELTFSAFHGESAGDTVDFRFRDTRSQQEIVSTLLSWPRIVGGMDVAPLTNFLYKNHTDPLSAAIANLKMSAPYGIASNRILRGIASGLFLSKKPNLDSLISDPYSIPLDRPLDPSSVAAGKVRETLEGITSNVDILPIIQCARPEDRSLFASVLGAQRPFYPKVVHDIYECSHFSTLDKFAKRFTCTRTLVEVASRSGEFDSLMTLVADSKLVRKITTDLMTILKLVEQPPLEHLSVFHLCSQLRERWGVGSLMGVTTIHPSELGRVHSVSSMFDNFLYREGGVVVCRVECSVPRQLFSSRGPFPPYLGSSTATRLMDKGVSVINPSPPLRSAIKAITIRDMIASQGSDMWNLLNQIASSRCSIAIRDLELLAPRRVGGTIIHRYQTGQLAEGAHLMTLPNASSHFTFSSDLSGELAKGDKNFPASFQDIYLYLEGVITIGMERDTHQSMTFVISTNMTGFPSIEDQLVSLTFAGAYSVPTVVNSYYLVSEQAVYSKGMESTLRWKKGRVISPKKESVTNSDISLAISDLVTVSLTKRREVNRSLTGQKSGPLLGCPIDVPELRRITLETLLAGYAHAVLETVFFGSILSSATFPVFKKQVLSRSYLLSCNIYGILTPAVSIVSQYSGCPVLLRPRLGHMGQRSFGSACAQELFSQCEKLFDMVLTNRGPLAWSRPHRVYSDSYHSESSAYISAILKQVICRSNLEVIQVWQYVRRLARYFISLRGRITSEDLLLEELSLLMGKLNIKGTCVEVYPGLPEDMLRLLRSLDEFPRLAHTYPDQNIDHQLLVLSPPVPILPRENIIVTGQMLPLLLPTLTRKQVIISHSVRATTVLSSSQYVWTPVIKHLSGAVIVVGVGSGGLANMILKSTDCQVIGTELNTTLSPLGHSFVSYIPPEVENTARYTTAALSWVGSGDLSSEDMSSDILALIAELEGDCIILVDAEGIDNNSRVRFSSLVSKTRCKGVGFKVLLSEAETGLLRTSIDLSSHCGMEWWPSLIHPLNETVVFTTGYHPPSFPTPLSTLSWNYYTEENLSVVNRLFSHKRQASIDLSLSIIFSRPVPLDLPDRVTPGDLAGVCRDLKQLMSTRNQLDRAQAVEDCCNELTLGDGPPTLLLLLPRAVACAVARCLSLW